MGAKSFSFVVTGHSYNIKKYAFLLFTKNTNMKTRISHPLACILWTLNVPRASETQLGKSSTLNFVV